MRTIEVRRIDGENKIFIDNELFDWGLDESSLEEVDKIENKQELEKVHKNIRQYLLACLELFLDRKITIQQLYEGLKTGKI